jgi:hypothetical protein
MFDHVRALSIAARPLPRSTSSRRSLTSLTAGIVMSRGRSRKIGAPITIRRGGVAGSLPSGRRPQSRAQGLRALPRISLALAQCCRAMRCRRSGLRRRANVSCKTFSSSRKHVGSSTFPQIRLGVAEGLVCRPGSVPGRLAASRSAAIHLGPPLPATSCGPPAHSGGQPSDVRCSTLLRAGFAKPVRSPGPLVVSCTTVSPLPPRGLRGLDKLDRRGPREGGLFSVALSRGLLRVGVAHRPALGSPDLPRHHTGAAAARPTPPHP